MLLFIYRLYYDSLFFFLMLYRHLVALKEYLQALSLVETLAGSGDVAVLAALGRVHLQLGCVKIAQQLFTEVERAFDSPNSNPLVLMNRGCISSSTILLFFFFFFFWLFVFVIDCVFDGLNICFLHWINLQKQLKALMQCYKWIPIILLLRTTEAYLTPPSFFLPAPLFSSDVLLNLIRYLTKNKYAGYIRVT